MDHTGMTLSGFCDMYDAPDQTKQEIEELSWCMHCCTQFVCAFADDTNSSGRGGVSSAQEHAHRTR
eukprot:2323351-Prymnesium_polylepis.1